MTDCCSFKPIEKSLNRFEPSKSSATPTEFFGFTFQNNDSNFEDCFKDTSKAGILVIAALIAVATTPIWTPLYVVYLIIKKIANKK